MHTLFLLSLKQCFEPSSRNESWRKNSVVSEPEESKLTTYPYYHSIIFIKIVSGQSKSLADHVLLHITFISHDHDWQIKSKYILRMALIMTQNHSLIPFIWKPFFYWIQLSRCYSDKIIFGQVIANRVIQKIFEHCKFERLRGPWRHCAIQLKFHTFYFLVHCHILELGTSWISNIGAFDAP